MKIKELMEKRDELHAKMEGMIKTAETEERAMNEDEIAEFDAAEAEIRAIDETIARMEKTAKFEKKVVEPGTEDRAVLEEKEFADYVFGKITEMRAGEANIDLSGNGAIIPTSIANRIIKAVRDICPIFEGATVYNVKGTLKVPVWGKTTKGHDIAVAYQTEFTEITADSGVFTSIELGGYLAGALTLIGRSVENNGSFNVVEFIVKQMAEEIAAFLEKELLVGTVGKATGALSTTNKMTANGQNAITADELINLQAQIKQAYQNDACWTMHPDTYAALKKLKDSNGRYLLQDDITSEIPYKLLGKPVHLSDNMPTLGAGAKAVLYGSYSGLSVNMRENISIEVLREKFATQHAIGIISWFEFDSKVTDANKLAVLEMAS